MTPGARRTVMAWTIGESGDPQRRAGKPIGLGPTTDRYPSARGDDVAVGWV